jgi:predicted RNA-binding protein with PIN domain
MARMPYLIDGHNLIGQTAGLSLADLDDEQQLIELLRAYLVRVDKKGVVIFDKGLPGGAGRWSNSVLEVRFAPHPKSADDLIRARLKAEGNPRGLTVVTGDRELSEAAQQAGARVVKSADFARAMLAKPGIDKAKSEKESGLSAEAAAAWEEEFKRKR